MHRPSLHLLVVAEMVRERLTEAVGLLNNRCENGELLTAKQS